MNPIFIKSEAKKSLTGANSSSMFGNGQAEAKNALIDNTDYLRTTD